MKHFTYTEAAMIAALFCLASLPTYSGTSSTVECLIKKQDTILIIKNSSPFSLTLKTRTNSEYNQRVNSGRTTIILGLEQLPAILEIHNNSEVWEIFRYCKITKTNSE